MKEPKVASTGERIKKLAAGQFATIESFKGGSGSLQARKLSTGETKLYWRYTHKLAKLRDEIGLWDSSAPPLSTDPTAKGYSIRAASDVCRARAKIHADGKLTDGWPGYKVRLKAEQGAFEAKRAKAKAAEERMSEQTLSRLLDTYSEHLEHEGRRSHADARSIFQVHIKTPWPALVAEPAANISSEQVADIIRQVRLNHGRTANKLRSYLHAAFQCAATAKYSPTLPASFKLFAVVANPVTVIPVDTAANKADKNPLSKSELRRYSKSLAAIEEVKGAVLRLHLLTGGQRVEQFVKLLKADVLPDQITLIDPKGKRNDALRHRVPLTPAAKKEVAFLQSWNAKVIADTKTVDEPAAPPIATSGKGGKKNSLMRDTLTTAFPYLISTDGGATHVSAMTMTRWAQGAAHSIPEFQLKRVRSGVETALAKAGVSLDLRGLLQSHGLSGLQRKHYDGHDYMPELKVVLLTLGKLLDAKDQSRLSRKPAQRG